jgi:hypothetical protein
MQGLIIAAIQLLAQALIFKQQLTAGLSWLFRAGWGALGRLYQCVTLLARHSEDLTPKSLSAALAPSTDWDWNEAANDELWWITTPHAAIFEDSIRTQRLNALRAGADDPSMWRNAALLDSPQR